jgi:hypothetical protein
MARPTTYVDSLDEEDVLPGKNLSGTHERQTLNNQHLMLVKPNLLTSACFNTISTTSASLVELATFYVATDRCGLKDSATGLGVDAAIYAWNSGANNFTVGLRYVDPYGTGNNDHTVAVSSNQTSKYWRSIAENGSDLIEADGTEQEVRLIASTTAGTLYIAGYMLIGAQLT